MDRAAVSEAANPSSNLGGSTTFSGQGWIVAADFRDAVDEWADGLGTFAGAKAFGAVEFLQ